jgi:protein phosphatase 1L
VDWEDQSVEQLLLQWFSCPDKVLVAANVGDARVVLCRGGQAVQLTVDHKPDVEAERKRIEAKNPTPKKPLVVNVEGTWRVGGLLALSRAFGDVYLKE